MGPNGQAAYAFPSPFFYVSDIFSLLDFVFSLIFRALAELFALFLPEDKITTWEKF